MKMEYMLDTDTISFALKGEGRISEKIVSFKPSQLCISSITLAELRFGAEKRDSKKLKKLIDDLVAEITVLSFDFEAAMEFGSLSAKLQKKGTPIGSFDTLLASHAKSENLIFVTNNERHFSRVRGLKTENWYES